MYRAFLFDLDGTLLDSEVLWVEAVGRALAERGHTLDIAALTGIVYGHAWSDISLTLAAQFPNAFGSLEEMTTVCGQHFQDLRQSRDIRIHSSIELLVQLAAEYPVAVVSGSMRADIAERLTELELLGQVRFYLGSEDYAPGKPDPACYRLAAERLQIPPAECLVFEDSAAGVIAAKAAGMGCVALQRPGAPAQDFSAADLVVADLRDCGQYGLLPDR